VTNAAVITEEGRQVTDLSKIAEVVGEAARLEVVFEPKVSLARMSEVWGKLPEAADAEVRTTSGLDLAKLSAVPIRPRMHPPDPPWLTIEIETSGKAISRLRVGRHEFSSVGDFEKRFGGLFGRAIASGGYDKTVTLNVQAASAWATVTVGDMETIANTIRRAGLAGLGLVFAEDIPPEDIEYVTE
jgi:hypothetical protein